MNKLFLYLVEVPPYDAGAGGYQTVSNVQLVDEKFVSSAHSMFIKIFLVITARQIQEAMKEVLSETESVERSILSSNIYTKSGRVKIINHKISPRRRPTTATGPSIGTVLCSGTEILVFL